MFDILYGPLDQKNPYSIIDAGEAFGAKWSPTRYNVATLQPTTHCSLNSDALSKMMSPHCTCCTF